MKDAEAASEVSMQEASLRLHDYDRLKLQLGSLLREVLRLAEKMKDPEKLGKFRDLLARLVEDRFTLAVVGQFNRGKSSLMNAILGLERLPVGVLPLTSAITKVSYGNPERVLVEYLGSSLKGEIPLEQLADYVTEAGNPGNQKRVASVEVQLPSEFLRRGLYFVDTPGVGSAIAANTATTEQFLPQADAVLFVTSFDSPLSKEELEFLWKVRDYVRKVFFVVNKLDLVTPAERDHVLSFIRIRLEQEAGLRGLCLYGVSALRGLRAKLTSSASELADSGLPGLERELIEFLTTQRARESLLHICDGALSLLGELDLRAMQGDQAAILTELKGRLSQTRNHLSGSLGRGARLSADVRHAANSPHDLELMEAVRHPCQVCVRVADALMKFMAKFQYAIMVNENERLALASRGGLCPLHTWQYAEMASPQGISAAFPAVLMTLSRRLRDLTEMDSSAGLGLRTGDFVPGPEKCRACQEQASAEEAVINKILEQVGSENGWEATGVPVLCLPHLSAVLRKIVDSGLGKTLVDFEAAVLERLAENMERYALKHDALRRSSWSEDERVAYHRGLSQLVGDKRLRAPWRVEYLL